MVTLTWDKNAETDIESYRIYRNAATGSTFKLLAANIIETTFKDANIDSHQYEYTVVAVRHHQQSDYSNRVKTQASWVRAPGRIEAEAAAELSDASVARTSDIDGKLNLTGSRGIGDKAIITYQLTVEKSGNYNLTYRLAAPRDTEGFAILVNDKELARERITSTGGYNKWKTQTGITIYLEKGNSKLTLKSLDSHWKLNWINLKHD